MDGRQPLGDIGIDERMILKCKVKVKQSRYRPGVAQRVKQSRYRPGVAQRVAGS
jgi:hypothetical protein